MPDSEIIDIARTDVYKKVTAKFSQIMAIAFLLGLIIPGMVILLDVVMKDAILLKQEIESITTIPIVGNILFSSLPHYSTFLEQQNSPIAESFRTLYTNLQYFTKGKQHQVLLVTSSMPHEGKTFTSINLATVFASFGKKTCLLSFDLRLAKIHQVFKISGEIGISTFLINMSTIDEIVYQSGIKNLDIIPAGPVPPNPIELIASGRTAELFDYLKINYDCVLIDSPPIGVVADALLLAGFSDINILITRQNHTKKKVLASIIKELEANGIGNNAIIFNGIRQSKFMGDYTNSYGYYNQDKLKWWKKILGFLKQLRNTKKTLL